MYFLFWATTHKDVTELKIVEYLEMLKKNMASL